MDEADARTVVGHYHADMAHRADMAGGACKEDQVAGAGLFKGYLRALIGEVHRGAGHFDAEVAKHIADEARAVETRGGRGAAKTVRLAQQCFGKGHQAVGRYGVGAWGRVHISIEAVDVFHPAGQRRIAPAGEEDEGERYEVYVAHIAMAANKIGPRHGQKLPSLLQRGVDRQTDMLPLKRRDGVITAGLHELGFCSCYDEIASCLARTGVAGLLLVLLRGCHVALGTGA